MINHAFLSFSLLPFCPDQFIELFLRGVRPAAAAAFFVQDAQSVFFSAFPREKKEEVILGMKCEPAPYLLSSVTNGASQEAEEKIEQEKCPWS